MASNDSNRSDPKHVEASGEVLKALLIGDSNASTSQQIPEDNFRDMYQDNEVIPPPYNPFLWQHLLEQSVRLRRLVTTFSHNTVGLGWSLAPLVDPLDDENDEAEKALFKQERKDILPLFQRPNNEMPFVTVQRLVHEDKETTGTGYMEVTRNMRGLIDGLYHIPSHTIRFRRDDMGFIQIRENNRRRYFKRFGDMRTMSAKNGDFDVRVANQDRGTEIIVFRVYSSRSSYYGIPRYVAAAPAITGNRLASLWNVSFFENDATGRMAVVVSGGELAPSSIEMIQSFVSSKGKGVQNAHRVMVLQATPKQGALGETVATKIDLVPLTIGIQEDAGFLDYRKANDEELREAFGIGKIFLGTAEDVNRASAMETRKATIEQVFIPEIVEWEYRINAKILHDPRYGLGVQHTEFRLERPKSALRISDAEIRDLVSGGGVTPNDLRDALSKPLFTEDWGNIPMPIALAILGKAGGRDGQPQRPDGLPANQNIKNPSNTAKWQDAVRNLRIRVEEQLTKDGISRQDLDELLESIEHNETVESY